MCVAHNLEVPMCKLELDSRLHDVYRVGAMRKVDLYMLGYIVRRVQWHGTRLIGFFVGAFTKWLDNGASDMVVVNN